MDITMKEAEVVATWPNNINVWPNGRGMNLSLKL